MHYPDMNRIIYILFFPIYLIFLSIMVIRNFLYDKKIFASRKLTCRVISVGNVSMGGTGKSPIVISLAKELQKKYQVAILSRGYKRESKCAILVSDGKSNITDWRIVGDEPALMSKILTGIPIVVDANRSRGGKYLVDNFNPDIIILDDAFQHRKIYRDIDVVLIDASRKTLFHFLREPLNSIRRADLIILTKATHDSSISYWKSQLSNHDIPIIESKNVINNMLTNQNGESINAKSINGKSALLFSGIGNPDSFNHIVTQLNVNIVDHIIFRDHHHYNNSDLNRIKEKFNNTGADTILTTEKDSIKLPKTKLPILTVLVDLLLPHEAINIIKEKMK